MTVPQIYVVSDATPDELSAAQNVLILGNALGTDTHLWERAMPTLSAEYTVVRFDMPGHGKSPAATASFSLEEVADAVIAEADRLGISTFDYAGVSVGGAVALELAHKYPERIKHSILVCSSAYKGGPDAWAERIALVTEQGTAAVVPMVAARWFSEEFLLKDPAAVKAVLEMVAATDDSSYAKTCEALGNFDARGYLSEIAVPTLVISGALDPVATPEAGAVVAQNVQNGQQVLIAGASHQAVVEEPLEVAKAMTAFIATT